jgi:hypothetical protein
MGSKSAEFTEATENLARFVAVAGDGFEDTKTPCRLERENVGKTAITGLLSA